MVSRPRTRTRGSTNPGWVFRVFFARKLAFALVFFCLGAALPAGGSKEKDTIIEVTGIVRLVRGMLGPSPEFVITGPDHEWYVPRQEEHKLKDLQHQTVTVKGTETVVNLTFANGMPAGERRTLTNIKILAIDE